MVYDLYFGYLAQLLQLTHVYLESFIGEAGNYEPRHILRLLHNLFEVLSVWADNFEVFISQIVIEQPIVLHFVLYCQSQDYSQLLCCEIHIKCVMVEDEEAEEGLYVLLDEVGLA